MPDSRPNPILLLILDGWGQAKDGPGNAISQASTPNLDRIASTCPGTLLECSGPMVGLPEGQMGNSEVGHMNIGAGRIVYQDIMRINLAIENGELSQNQVLNNLFEQIRSDKCLHLMGLVSDGGVHSMQHHLHSIIDIARDKKVKDIAVHCFLDGRDTSPTSGAGFVARLSDHLRNAGIGRIATVTGRFYAMDRDKRWERTKLAYDALTMGAGSKARDSVQLIRDSYEKGLTDEFIKPHVIVDNNGSPMATLEDGDGLVFFNFRADRARQLTMALHENDFNEFEREKKPRLNMATMTRYDKYFSLPVLFAPEKLNSILGEVISRKNLAQLRIAETEKYAHVTYFFNGGVEAPFPGEERLLIPSPRDVATYDLKPEMSVYRVAETLIREINDRGFDLYVCNFANLDMVGHTGSIPATIKACEAVDKCVGMVEQAMTGRKGTILLTADHGNAEDMLSEEGKVKTSHSLNPVPLKIINGPRNAGRLKSGILADIAPTILDLWGLDQPSEMTGKSLIR